MNLFALSPALKVAAGLAVGIAFAGAIAYGVTTGGVHSADTPKFSAGTIGELATATPILERPPGGQPIRPAPPVPIPNTAVAGLDRGGLFGDGLTNVPKVDVTEWKTYSNAK